MNHATHGFASIAMLVDSLSALDPQSCQDNSMEPCSVGVDKDHAKGGGKDPEFMFSCDPTEPSPMLTPSV
jgi:hypothetical protein